MYQVRTKVNVIIHSIRTINTFFFVLLNILMSLFIFFVFNRIIINLMNWSINQIHLYFKRYCNKTENTL